MKPLTYSQSLAYELARSLIGSKVSELSHQIEVEERRQSPSRTRIAELEAQMVAYWREREHLAPDDVEAVRGVVSRYSRDPEGVRVLLSGVDG